MALNLATMDEGAMRNFREFLETYNRISENCFNRCVGTLLDRKLSEEELNCCDNCTTKNIRLNYKILKSYMIEQPKITEAKVKQAALEADEVMKKLKEEGKDFQQVSPEEMAGRMMGGMQSSVPNPSEASSESKN